MKLLPRYPLILKDETYLTLYQYAASKGVSLGKYINKLLNDEAQRIKEGGPPEVHICSICGKIPVIYVAWLNGVSSYFCKLHKPSVRSCDGYKKIGER